VLRSLFGGCLVGVLLCVCVRCGWPSRSLLLRLFRLARFVFGRRCRQCVCVCSGLLVFCVARGSVLRVVSGLVSEWVSCFAAAFLSVVLVFLLLLVAAVVRGLERSALASLLSVRRFRAWALLCVFLCLRGRRGGARKRRKKTRYASALSWSGRTVFWSCLLGVFYYLLLSGDVGWRHRFDCVSSDAASAGSGVLSRRMGVHICGFCLPLYVAGVWSCDTVVGCRAPPKSDRAGRRRKPPPDVFVNVRPVERSFFLLGGRKPP